MLTTSSKNISFSGDVKVNEKVVADLHASYSGANDAYFNITINDLINANAKRDDLINDISEFINQMLDAIVDFND